MRKKLLLAAVVLILVIAVPIVIAQLANFEQVIHVNGSATYPSNSTSTPASTVAPVDSPTSTLKFSLWFLNGTAFPTSINGNSLYVFLADSQALSIGRYTPNAVVLKNDGTAPLTVNVTSSNVNLPSDLSLQIGDRNSIANGFTVIQPGQNATMQLVILLVLSNSPHSSGTTFSYSFDMHITAIQA